MAKSGLDYFPLACNFEDKIELIEAEFGLEGLAIVVKLYQKIYGEFGYYCEWNDEVALLFSRKACGLKEGGNVVSEVINAAIKRGIFDADMFHEYGILTSAGIQKRYFEAVKRRTEIEVEKDYLLLSASKIPKNVNINQKNVCRNEENVCRNQQRKVKESKVNKSKEKESKVEKRKEIKEKKAVVFYYDDPELNQSFADYVDMRKKIKKPMNERAIELAKRKLETLAKIPFSDDIDIALAVQILDQSVFNSWQGLYPVKQDDQKMRGNKDILNEWRNS